MESQPKSNILKNRKFKARPYFRLLPSAIGVALAVFFLSAPLWAIENKQQIKDIILQGARLPLQTGNQKAATVADNVPDIAAGKAPVVEEVKPPVTARLPMPKQIAAPPQPVTPVITNAVANSDFDMRLNAANAQADSLRQSLDYMNQQLGEIQNKIAAQLPAMNGAANDAAIQDRLEKMENRLREITARRAATASAPLPVKHRVAEQVQKKHGIKHKAVSSNNRWVLRAATPGEAWIAANSDTSALRSVKVGDRVPGIGRVRAIRQEGQNWVVAGSAGSIR